MREDISQEDKQLNLPEKMGAVKKEEDTHSDSSHLQVKHQEESEILFGIEDTSSKISDLMEDITSHIATNNLEKK